MSSSPPIEPCQKIGVKVELYELRITLRIMAKERKSMIKHLRQRQLS